MEMSSSGKNVQVEKTSNTSKLKTSIPLKNSLCAAARPPRKKKLLSISLEVVRARFSGNLVLDKIAKQESRECGLKDVFGTERSIN